MKSKLALGLAVGVALLVAMAAVTAVVLYTYNAGVAQNSPQAPQVVYLTVENLNVYNAGAAQEAATKGPLPGVGPQPYPGRPFAYGPFGFGFAGLRCLFPLLFFALIFALLRGLWWRRHWHGGWHHGPWERHGPPFFEEWHRRAHESETRQA